MYLLCGLSKDSEEGMMAVISGGGNSMYLLCTSVEELRRGTVSFEASEGGTAGMKPDSLPMEAMGYGK